MANNETTVNKTLFLEKVRQSNAACQNGDFESAVKLYSEAIDLDQTNAILHSNRSAALIQLNKYSQALQDAIKARELNPKWPKAYYRQGVALQCLGRYPDALAAFASGLAQDSKNVQLLTGLIEAAMKSPLRATLEPSYCQLQAMRLDKSPFVIISVIGQELLALNHYAAAIVVLESALRVSTCSLKLRGSVFSALSSAYWALNSLEKAISYMQQDLAVARTLGDLSGECRAHGNLGAAYFSKGNYKAALASHRHQLVLAMKCKDNHAAAAALTSLGHVYAATSDYSNALASHKQCVQLVKQMNNTLQEAREIGNVGAVYLAMGDFENAVECHTEHLRLAKQLPNKVEEARAYSNLGSSYHFHRNFEQAITFHNQVQQLAQELKDKAIESRAFAGLGHAARCMGDYQQAKTWHEKQLEVALVTRDKTGEGRACSNLGIVYQLMGDNDAALKLHQAHLNIARSLQDRAGMGRAYGNIGNAYSAMGFYKEAIKYHKQELIISKEVNDRNSEAATHGNLAVAYQALQMHEMALLHYQSHLTIARELKDAVGEACALCNLGNCLSSRSEFTQAIPYYEGYLMVSQELNDVEAEAKACHFLGYAHYCLANYQEAIRYYNQNLVLAKDLQDRMNLGHAYCNLGLAHLALNNYQTALECQKYFLAIAHMLKHVQGKFRAMGNVADVLMKMKNTSEAVQVYHKQLLLAKQCGEKVLEAGAYLALGLAHMVLKCYDKALGYHTQELILYQDLNDVRGECRAHTHLGAVHMVLGNYTNAIKCYEEHLERAQELKDCLLQAQAFGNLGISHLNMSHFEDAIGYFEQQLATLEQVVDSTSLLDKARGYGNLGDCYEALGDYEEAIKCLDQYLTLALKIKSLRDQERAYRGLGNSHKCIGNLQQSLVCFEKRLVVSHELQNPSAKASAYGELGYIHSLLGNFEQATSCMEHQLNIGTDLEDKDIEAEAACGLGNVYHQTGDFETALRYHQMDLTISEQTCNLNGQARAYGNLGLAYESLGKLNQAVQYQEQHLNIATQIGDNTVKILAFSSLGRIYHVMGDSYQAVNYLQQGLVIAEQVGQREDEAKIRHRLGLALWSHTDLEGSQQQLYRAADLFEAMRRESQASTDYRMSLFDLQTASYQALQRVLVALGRFDEALVVAERGRTRAFVDLLMERQGVSMKRSRLEEAVTSSASGIVDVVNRQKATVIYYSLVTGYLYIWVIVPNKGIVKFHQHNFSDVYAGDETNTTESPGTTCILEQYIASMRESLGVEIQTQQPTKTELDTETDENWNQHMEELSDKLSQEKDRSGFLRMVNRSHLFNSSNYSLSSLFSLGSVTGSHISGSTSRPGSIRSRPPIWPGPACLNALYDILIAPIENFLPTTQPRDLLLVLEGDLYLIPFSVLKGSTHSEYLCENYTLLVTPSISSLCTSLRSNQKPTSETTSALVVGNPRLLSSITDQWGWENAPYAEQEANQVADILGTTAMVNSLATKETVLRQMPQVECVHFATHISWKLSALVLSPGDVVDPPPSSSKRLSHTESVSGLENEDDANSEVTSSLDLPALSEFLLTAADILNMKLNARLVVVSSCHTRNHHGKASADGIVALTRALLAAGVQCVMVSLWPVPDTAVQIFLRTFYSSLLQGSRISRALNEAMHTVQNTKQFAHPANWAGFVLIGNDVKLSSKVALMGQALCELMKTPDKCRDALRVILHLVEKSLLRIHRGHKNAMYTTQKSIENKVGMVQGWKDLLISVGFRFEPVSNGIPASVFFPQSDPSERLTQCSASLQALLGLSVTSLHALSKLLGSPEVADDIISLIRQVNSHFAMKDYECDSIEIPVSMKLWRVGGCHELLASLGFDLREVGQDQVTLRTGKQANKRNIQFALQALLALFDTQEAPKSLSLEESSSMESLVSTQSEASQGTPPPPPPSLGLCRPRSNFLGSSNGAFSSYVRNRGEPDGRIAINSDLKGRDSDAAFTPSPIESIKTKLNENIEERHKPKLLSTLPHQRTLKYNKSLENRISNSEELSSSSASSVTDWDNGQATIRRQISRHYSPVAAVPETSTEEAKEPDDGLWRQKLPSLTLKPSKAEKLNLKLNPNFSHSLPVRGAASMFLQDSALKNFDDLTGTKNQAVRENILANQRSRLHREVSMTEIYQNRNVDLGLAPSLSKLLISSTEDDIKPIKLDLQNGMNGINAIYAHPPPLPPPRQAKPWNSGFKLGLNPVNSFGGTRRDEGDGHSMTESVYCGCNKAVCNHQAQVQSAKFVNCLKELRSQVESNPGKHMRGNVEAFISLEENGANGVIPSNLNVAEFIDQLLESNEEEMKTRDTTKTYVKFGTSSFMSILIFRALEFQVTIMSRFPLIIFREPFLVDFEGINHPMFVETYRFLMH
uniref:Uncharacterized protein n=1 Tax=Strigamia maritima TaxID=126957 RepID=T1J2M9_STRMM